MVLKRTKSILEIKSESFAGRIIKLHHYLKTDKKELVISKQLYRSGTSIGANIAESRYAQSDADFVSKLSIALKEANETCYWLDCLKNANIIDQKGYDSIYADAIELVKILTSAVKTKKENMGNQTY
ncbi:MAG: four helix bundle protein [Prevotella sp.]|nr:four helix bundle protein [Prevotella sp.]